MDSQKVLIVNLMFGLANCFRALSSYIELAKITNRKLMILKHKSKYDYSVTDFFDWDAMGITYTDSIPKIDKSFIEGKSLNNLNYYCANIQPVIECSDKVIYVETSKSLCFPGKCDPKTMRNRYASLILKKEIQESFDKFASENLPEDFLVLHIRQGDLDHGQRFRENFDIQEYINKAEKFNIKNWICCTDNKDVQNKFEDRCLKIVIPKEFRNGKESLFDFLIISRASHVIGTYTSSFSIEAFYFGLKGIRFTTVGSKVNLFHFPYMCYFFGEIISLIIFFVCILIFVVSLLYFKIIGIVIIGLIMLFKILTVEIVNYILDDIPIEIDLR